MSNIVKFEPISRKRFIFEKSDIENPHESINFLFSIVVATYNADLYLKDTIESVINQTLDFKNNVQLILVNDGSTDNSFNICMEYANEYPDNILLIDKENGGVSSARNVGMLYAKGKFINFLDSDDQLGVNVLERVNNFYKNNEKYVDVVAIKNELFGEKTGDSWFNKVYHNGDRVINLWNEPQIYLNSVNNCFFHSRIANFLYFDETISISEDLKVVNTVLMNKYALGVMNSCVYRYRITSGATSLASSARTKPDWYFPYLNRVALWLFSLAKDKCGFVPEFIQYTLLRDIYNRFNNNMDFVKVVPLYQREEYKKALFSCFDYIDDEVICKNSFLNTNWHIYFLSCKYGKPIISKASDNTMNFEFSSGTKIQMKLFVGFSYFDIQEDEAVLEGYIPLPVFDKETKLNLIIKCGNNQVRTIMLDRVNNDNVAFDDVITLKRYHFKSYITIGNFNPETIDISVNLDGESYPVSLSGFGNWFPLSIKFKDPIFYKNGTLLSTWGHRLVLSQVNKKEYIKRELSNISYLDSINDQYAKEALYFYKDHLKNYKKTSKQKEIWIISDRHVAAGDNGEAFYRYLRDNKKDIDFYFAIDKSSSDYGRLKADGFNVVGIGSVTYKKLFMKASKIISSYNEQSELNPFFKNDYMKELIGYKKYVFLQHGIIKDDVSTYYSRKKMRMDMFVTSTKPEYESIVSNDAYLCDETITKLTGLPRYDYLENDPEKTIVLMPTWRNKQVVFGIDGLGAVVNKDFTNSYYYKFYHSLLSDKRLKNMLKKYGYVLKYFPHNNMLPTNSFFEDACDENIKIIRDNRSYTEIFKKAALMITDYSSTPFDFAYLGKPVIYCQGDADDFFSSHTYLKGYFSYEENGLGPVTIGIDDLLDKLEFYLKNNCKNDEKYILRANEFYSFRDRNNSERVFNEIIKLK